MLEERGLAARRCTTNKCRPRTPLGFGSHQEDKPHFQLAGEHNSWRNTREKRGGAAADHLMGAALQREGELPKAFNHLTVSGFGCFIMTKGRKRDIGEKMEDWSWKKKRPSQHRMTLTQRQFISEAKVAMPHYDHPPPPRPHPHSPISHFTISKGDL